MKVKAVYFQIRKILLTHTQHLKRNERTKKEKEITWKRKMWTAGNKTSDLGRAGTMLKGSARATAMQILQQTKKDEGPEEMSPRTKM